MRPKIGVTVSRRTGWRVFPFMALNILIAGGCALRWDSARAADPDRDALERRLVLEALAADKPVLGICRGAQMLNIAQGGNLHQRAYDHYTDSREYRTILPRKDIAILEKTALAGIAGTAPMRVNALHSQAVDRLGADLQVAARDEGGMVQAIERINPPFALGVQWHPEYLIYARRQRALFRALVTAARSSRC